MNKAAFWGCLMQVVVGGCGAPTEPRPESPLPPTAATTWPGRAAASAGQPVDLPGRKVVDTVEIADLQSICEAVEKPGTPEEAALASIVQHLAGELRSAGARDRIHALENGRLIHWMQQLRRDAIATGLTPCAFADRWEPWLLASRTARPPVSPTNAAVPSGLPSATVAAGSSGAVPSAAPVTTAPAVAQVPGARTVQSPGALAFDQAGCPAPGFPPYPQEAREAQVEATIIARCVVQTNGTLNCSMIQSHPLFDQTTRVFLALKRVPPFTVGGTPVRVACNYPFRFKLK